MLDSAADQAGNDAVQGILKHLADKAMLARIESEWAILPSVQSYDKLQLQKLAKLGPIVALNATRIRTDAFIATSASIGVLELM
ncbi:unnamed protein product [Clonostachys rosea f. rosea IK726]|uniref:Uncharacterized protein n=1 Tax=Clonostachys rosea f. rosea IK726 TaxID=1349383 RepID=A0ACA9USF1_BIOOC|nr:unnamed protein product [Clonostachys rosea f. rosea IK726]